MPKRRMKGGVVIIGSLLWDPADHRKQWRETLSMRSRQPISVPIRYGRKSESRSNTHSMVFSTNIKKEDWGSAWFVPFKNSIGSYAEFYQQAIDLSWAEGISSDKYPDRLAAAWGGAIGLKVSGRYSRILGYATHWQNGFKKVKNFKSRRFCLTNERSAITSRGYLNFPVRIPKGYDYLFATPCEPNTGTYPTAEEIVDAIAKSEPPYERYIRENIRHKISLTIHDKLVKLRPSLAPKCGITMR